MMMPISCVYRLAECERIVEQTESQIEVSLGVANWLGASRESKVP